MIQVCIRTTEFMNILIYRSNNHKPLKELPYNLHYLLTRQNVNVITYGSEKILDINDIEYKNI